MTTPTYNFADIASVVLDSVFNSGKSKPIIHMHSLYNEEGAYVMAYSGYDFLTKDKVLTLSGKEPPKSDVEFNSWMETLKHGKNGEKAFTIG